MTEVKIKKEEVKRPKTQKDDCLAVIKTGGKQYLVEVGKSYNFEKLPGKEGDSVTFEDVLLLIEGEDIKIGKPRVEGSRVTAKIASQFQDKKVDVFKYKKRKRYRKSYGHRQELTKVEILEIK